MMVHVFSCHLNVVVLEDGMIYSLWENEPLTWKCVFCQVDRHLRKLDQELAKFKMELEADNAGITEILERRESFTGFNFLKK